MKIKENLVYAGLAIVLIWAVFLLDLVLAVDLRQYGIEPRTISGLKGVLFSPFLHLNLTHILANSGALFVLLALSLSYDRVLTVEALIIIILVGGGLVWLFGGPRTVHIGASGVIFGLIGFLLFSGIFQKNFEALIVSIIVFVLYGGALLSGFIPRSGVSWIGHLFGFLAGVLASWLARPTSGRT